MVVTISIVASALVSLTLTPMLAARLPAPMPHGRRGGTCSSAASTACWLVIASARPLPALPDRDAARLPRLGGADWLACS